MSWRRIVRTFGHHGQAPAPHDWITDQNTARAPITILQASQPAGARLHLALGISRDRVELDALRFNLERVPLDAPEADGLRRCRRGPYGNVVATGWHVAGDRAPAWRPRLAAACPPQVAQRALLNGVDAWEHWSLLYLELDWCCQAFTVDGGPWATIPLIETQVMAELAGRCL